MRSAFLLAVVACCAVASAQSVPLRVGSITVKPIDVYSEREETRGAIYRLADRLHLETRASVIRKLLLFHEGEEFHPERLAETERNLRALHFLKAASVTASPPHDGLVDIVVVTQDAWSIAPETQAANKGGQTTYGATISETNLFGLGKEVALKWNKGVDRRRVGIDYLDPALNASYWNAHLAYEVNSDGHDRTLNLRRPFYSFAAPWSTNLLLQNVLQDDHLYTNGVESARFRHDRRDFTLSGGEAIDPSDLDANRVVAGIRLVRDEFSRPTSTVLPADRDYRYLFVRFEHVENDFLTMNFVNKDLRYEDFNLGRQYSIGGGLSPRLIGAPTNSVFTRGSWSEGHRLGGQMFVLGSVTAESRFDGGAKNTIGNAAIHFVRRDDASYPTATVARIVVTSGWRLDRDVQFMADGDTGLRAYRLREFDGSRTFIANLEQRLYLGREIGQLASPGVVAFVDTGNATYGGLTRLFDLKTDVGLGIRIGLPRTPKNLLRIDLAYPLQRGNFGRRGVVLSISSGQAF